MANYRKRYSKMTDKWTPVAAVGKTLSTRKIAERIESGCGVDAPGSYIAWLCTQTAVHAMEMPGRRYDIGNLQSYEQVQKDHRGIV